MLVTFYCHIFNCLCTPDTKSLLIWIFFSSYLRFMTNFAVLVLLDTYNCLFSFSPSDHHAGASESEKREAENKFKEVGEAYEVLSGLPTYSIFSVSFFKKSMTPSRGNTILFRSS